MRHRHHTWGERVDDLRLSDVHNTADIDAKYHRMADIDERCRQLENGQLNWFSSGVRWFIVNAGFGAYILVFVTLFFIVGFLWYLVWRYLVSESFKDDTSMHALFNVLDLAVTFIYFMWVREAFKNYTEPLKALVRMNHRVRSLMANVYNFVLRSSSKKRSSTAANRAAALNFTHIFYVLTIYAYRIFSETDNEMHIERYVPVQSRVSRELAERVRISDARPYSVFEEGLSTFEELLSEMENGGSGVPTQADVEVIDRTVSAINAQLEDIYVAAHVHTPRIYRYHVLIFIFVYFLVVTPFTMVLRYKETAIFTYPIFMFLLLGFFIYQRFLGDPVHAPTQYTGMDPLAWRDTVMAEIGRRYASWLGQPLTAASCTPAAAPVLPRGAHGSVMAMRSGDFHELSSASGFSAHHHA